MSHSAAVSFWQNAQIDGRLITLARNYREKIGMPKGGFDSFEKWEEWRGEMILKHGDDSVRKDNYFEFEREIASIFPYSGILNSTAFSTILLDYYYLDELKIEHIEGHKHSDFGIVIIEKGRPFLSFKKEIEDGVYIKIGAKSSGNLIKEYLNKNGALIKSAQEHYLSLKKIPKDKKHKSYPNFERDNLIVGLSRYKISSLRNMGGLGRTKEEVLASLMRHIGYNKSLMTTSIVKTVIQRRRKMLKARRA